MPVPMQRHIATLVLAVTVIGARGQAFAQPEQAWRQLPVGPPAVQSPVGVCPGDTGLMYLGTFGGGVLRSRDAGRTWQPSNSGLTNLAVAAMAVDPTHCEIVYVAAFGTGIFKTSDSGRTWRLLADPGAALWLTVDPRRPEIVYVGTMGNGIHKSVDGGLTWRSVSTGLPASGIWTIQMHRDAPDVIYVGTSGDGAFKSVDGGASWSPLAIAPIVWSIAIDPRSPDTVYAGTNGDGVFRSDDGGTSFHRVGSPRDGRVLTLAHDPGRRGLIYAGTAGGGVAVSRDFGRTFDDTTLTDSLTIALTVQETGDVYASTGNDGVFVSGSYGAVWRPVAGSAVAAIPVQNIYSLAVDPARPWRVVGSTNDGGLIGSSDRGETWRRMGRGFGSRASRKVTFFPGDTTRVYAGSLSGGGLNVSHDGGDTWTSRPVGPPASYVWATAVDARTGALFAGTIGDGLWRSDDGGATFARLGASAFSDTRSIAVDGARILAGGRLGLHRSTDGGATWTQVLTPFISNITVDPGDPAVVYAASQTAGVLRSRDGGVTFTPLNDGLALLRTSRGNGVVIDPRRSTTLYVGTEGAGVFKSTDGGLSWRPINDGLANLVVLALAIDPERPDVLYAGGGGGVFATTTGGETPHP